MKSTFKKLAVVCLVIALVASTPLLTFAAVKKVFDNCEDSTHWQGNPVDTKDKKEGKGSISITADNGMAFENRLSKPMNFGVTESKGYIEMWIYVSDTSKLNGDGQIEFTSSGKCDADEYHWAVKDLKLKQGWNKVTLKLSAATKEGKPNLKAINYFRYYQVGYTGSLTLKIDGIVVKG